MKDFSIELAAENIVDHRSRDYFREVLSSFVNGNHRSAVVMLWSVVVCDLVYKLHELRDLYQDPVASLILQTIEAKQTSNPTSPEWEPVLLDEINQRTHLLEISEYHHLQGLHKTRHLSAHPVLSATNLLFSPNKETTRALIRNALEATLLKPPIFSKKIVVEFVSDIASKKALLPDQATLKRYLETKYFRNLHPAVEVEIIKSIWKFCFRLQNNDTNANRDINSRVLCLFFARNPIKFRETIIGNSAHFSEISAEDSPLNSLIYFLSECSSVYSALTDAAKVIITNFAKNSADTYAASRFLSADATEYIETIKGFDYQKLREISEENWKKLIYSAREDEKLQEALEIGISIYTQSGSFNGADVNFAKFVDAHLEEYDKTRLELLLSGIESNGQTYCRGRSRIDHAKVNARMSQLGININDYQNFGASI